MKTKVLSLFTLIDTEQCVTTDLCRPVKDSS